MMTQQHKLIFIKMRLMELKNGQMSFMLNGHKQQDCTTFHLDVHFQILPPSAKK